ncbi:MAG: hypothetical protein ACE5IQ_05810 [Candidatus Methylomirabilales bacterium]
MGLRCRHMAMDECGSRTNLLGQLRPEVQERLDVELLRVGDGLALMPALLQVKRKGVRVRMILPLEHDPGFPERLWDLEPFLAEGIDVRWGPTVRDRRLVADGRRAYRLDGEWIKLDPKLGSRPLASTDGTVHISSGEVLDKQERRARFDRLDRILCVRIWALGGRFPLYFSSERTPVDALSPGDRIKVLFVIIWGGSGLFSAFAPSELYYEGVGFRWIRSENRPP